MSPELERRRSSLCLLNNSRSLSRASVSPGVSSNSSEIPRFVVQSSTLSETAIPEET